VSDEADGPFLQAHDLVREYGAHRAVDGVSLALNPGRVLSIFGPNGAGKTTLLKMLAGGLKPSSGEVLIRGLSIQGIDRKWRSRIGVVSHQSFLYGHLSVMENLQFYGRLYGLRDLKSRIPDRLGEVGLADRAGSLVMSLSRGLRQRVALARALLHDPDVVLLDEPFTGLDAHAAEVLRNRLRVLKDGRRAVVLVTHNLTEGVQMADDVVIQVRGRFVVQRTRSEVPDDFQAFYRDTVDGAA
jgi:heme ABC exporter ATP-binding subunit CcmA